MILLDELPPYFGYAVTQTVGGGTLAEVTIYALSNLLSAALKLKRTVRRRLQPLGQLPGRDPADLGPDPEGGRQPPAGGGTPGQGITPVELGTDEIYHILRTRLMLAPTREDVGRRRVRVLRTRSRTR